MKETKIQILQYTITTVSTKPKKSPAWKCRAETAVK